MRTFDAAAVHGALPYPALIAALRHGFVEGGNVPGRHHHEIARPGHDPAALLLMPAWQPGGLTGVKLVHVCPGNDRQGLPSVQGLYVLFDGPTGSPLAVMDGAALTVRRTAATSALAASWLARDDARRLLVLGAGALAPHLARAHAAGRKLDVVWIWNRHRAGAEAVARELAAEGLPAVAVSDLDATLPQADIISSATMSRQPLIKGALVRHGTHVDLVGAFTPEMRESDDDLMARGEIYVDVRPGALAEAGDVLLAIQSGALEPKDIRGDLFELARGQCPGRADPEQITVFKSVGNALEDLVAARLVAC